MRCRLRFWSAGFVRIACLMLLCMAGALDIVGCGAKSAPYDRLCKIYEEYGAPSTPRDVAAVKITERVERELPGIYEKYVVVVMNPVEGRYHAFADLAREASQPNWRCDAIRAFYSGQDQPP
jgi:hypothetical protein